MPFNVDLHTHTFFSGDGVSSPEDLIASAQGKGLHGIAITDHNTCDAIDYLRGKKLITDEGFPVNGFQSLPDGELSFLLFPVSRPELFDAVITDDAGSVREIQVKQVGAESKWVWGAFKLTGKIFAELHQLWVEREKADQYIGTLVNAYLTEGGKAWGIKGGDQYVDVGTLHGYREAVRLLSSSQLVCCDEASR